VRRLLPGIGGAYEAQQGGKLVCQLAPFLVAAVRLPHGFQRKPGRGYGSKRIGERREQVGMEGDRRGGIYVRYNRNESARIVTRIRFPEQEKCSWPILPHREKPELRLKGRSTR
jgi:hypothetical protein